MSDPMDTVPRVEFWIEGSFDGDEWDLYWRGDDEATARIYLDDYRADADMPGERYRLLRVSVEADEVGQRGAGGP